MPKYSIYAKEKIQENSSTIQLCFQQEAVFINGNSTSKPIIITAGVSTCTVCIIFDPVTKLTIFSHIDETIDIEHSQNKLLLCLQEKKIALKALQITIAGSWLSHPSSAEHANLLKEFWFSKVANANLNTELLFNRDCISLDAATVINYIKEKTVDKFVGNKGHTQFDLIDYYLSESGENNESFIYLPGKREIAPAKLAADLIIKFCTEQVPNFDSSGKLNGIQVVKGSDSITKILVDMQNPCKSFFPIIGYNSLSGDIFIINEDCRYFHQDCINLLDLNTRASAAKTNGGSDKTRFYLTEIEDPYNLSLQVIEEKLKACTLSFFDTDTNLKWKKYPENKLIGKYIGRQVRFFTMATNESKRAQTLLKNLKEVGFAVEIETTSDEPSLIVDLNASKLTL